MRQEQPENTLQPTALVHEAYLRMAGQRTVDWRNRAPLLAIGSVPDLNKSTGYSGYAQGDLWLLKTP